MYKNIDDIERTLGVIVSKIDFTSITDKKVNYHYGDIYELQRYLNLKSKDNSALRALGESSFKYPLIWLVLPNKGKPNGYGYFLHNNTRIVISVNGDSQLLNTTRWNNSIKLISAIGDLLIKKLDSSYSQVVRNSNGTKKYSFDKRPNYSESSNESKVIDIWDALVIDLDLIINNNCLTEKDFKICQY